MPPSMPQCCPVGILPPVLRCQIGIHLRVKSFKLRQGSDTSELQQGNLHKCVPLQLGHQRPIIWQGFEMKTLTITSTFLKSQLFPGDKALSTAIQRSNSCYTAIANIIKEGGARSYLSWLGQGTFCTLRTDGAFCFTSIPTRHSKLRGVCSLQGQKNGGMVHLKSSGSLSLPGVGQSSSAGPLHIRRQCSSVKIFLANQKGLRVHFQNQALGH